MSAIGQVLVDADVLSDEQLKAAIANGGDLAETLIAQNLVEEHEYAAVVARHYGVPEAELDNLSCDPAVVALIPEALAKRTRCVPLSKEGALLTVASTNPGDENARRQLARAAGVSIKMHATGPQRLNGALASVYGSAKKGAASSKDPFQDLPALESIDRSIKHAIQETGSDESGNVGDLGDLARLELNDLDPPVVRLVNSILLKALKMNASDIHIEPLEKELRIRLRVDGCLLDVLRVPDEMKTSIVSRIKILASMDIAEKRIPQDGGIKVALSDTESIDFRCSCLPNIYGEKIVMRVLGTGQLKGSVDGLGLEGRSLELIREAIANPFGMILVTGPTGSGKTTTLYSVLNQLNEDDVNVVTAEDPVEYRLDGITQVNVRPTQGLTFDAAMRSFLRQDPDIILVGEMRDYETSAIAIKAALTGHLVLSTLHTNDAPSTVVRLVDMGIEPYLVASAVKLVIAQRLVRRICAHCKVDIDVSEAERTDIDEATLSSIEYLSKGAGCKKCNGIGYSGRVPVFEVMPVKSKDMKRAITEGGTEVQVGQIARREGTQSLAEGAIDLVNRGITTLEEAASIIIAE